MDRNTGGGSTAIGPGDQRFFYVQDDQGSVLALLDGTGKPVEGYLYEPYGKMYVVQPGSNRVVEWGNDDIITTRSLVDNPYSYTGQRHDPETDLMFYKARYYAPEFGRFISRDPIGIWTDQLNLGNGYTYTGNAPTTYTNPMGEWGVGIKVGGVLKVGLAFLGIGVDGEAGVGFMAENQLLAIQGCGMAYASGDVVGTATNSLDGETELVAGWGLGANGGFSSRVPSTRVIWRVKSKGDG